MNTMKILIIIKNYVHRTFPLDSYKCKKELVLKDKIIM